MTSQTPDEPVEKAATPTRGTTRPVSRPRGSARTPDGASEVPAGCPEGCAWVAKLRGGAQIYVRTCMLCRRIDWDDLARQADEIRATGRAQPDDVDLRTRLFDAESALAELVRLKDGPRDVTYERDKPIAWSRARAVLAQIPANGGNDHA